MKTILRATATMLAVSAIDLFPARGAEPAPEEVAGIAWGASVDEVKNAMAAKEVKQNQSWSKAAHLVFGNGNLAGLGVDAWDFDFVDGKMWRAIVTFSKNGDSETTRKTIKKMLVDKYGNPFAESSKPESAEWKLDNPKSHAQVTILLHFRTDKGRRPQLDYTNETMKKLVLPGESNGDPNGAGL